MSEKKARQDKRGRGSHEEMDRELYRQGGGQRKRRNKVRK